MSAFIDIVRPANRPLAATFDTFAVLAGSFFLALMAQVAIPIGFTPVPLTMQTFAVLLIGGVLGSKRGALAVLCYLAEGAMGLPVFQGAGFGLAKFMGPTGGYLIGFPLTAYLVGYLLEKGWRAHFAMSFIAMVAGTLMISVFGATWLALFIGSENALRLGVYPFIVGDVIKAVLAAGLVTSGTKALAKFA